MSSQSATTGAPRSADLVVISPCRDEALHCRTTLESMAAQTVRPALWLIVDDGSTDATPAILDSFASQHDWIKVLRRDDRGRRAVGPGVIEAFYAGLDSIDLHRYEYLCKLDLDLDLPPQYFEIMVRRMEADPQLGTCSGKAYYVDQSSGSLRSEKIGDEMSVGAAKFYRRECFEQIGGFVREVMWDGIDCHRCRMLGWKACSWDEPELRFIHLRPMGSSQHGIWSGRMRHGYGQYFMGTSLPYMTVSALYRMTRPPLIIGGMAMWWGYVRSMLRRDRRYDDPTFRKFLRRYQRLAMIYGKAGAVRRIERDAAERSRFNPAARPS